MSVQVSDMTGKGNADAAFVVVTRTLPVQFGVIVWAKGDAREEHWVVPLASRVLTGVGLASYPAEGLVVGGCSADDNVQQ